MMRSTIDPVKLVAQDNPQPHVDPFLRLLSTLWQTSTSVNLNVARNELRVYPSPSPELAAEISTHYDQLSHWLPGECDNCHHWVMERTEAYWSAHSHLCWKCLAWAVMMFEEKGHWPVAMVYESDEAQLGGMFDEED